MQTSPSSGTLDLKQCLQEFSLLKTEEANRNYEYFLLRQAMRGRYRWPTNWPKHIPKLVDNLCKRIVEQHSTYLMGGGFTSNISRPNTLEFRQAAERAEKILDRLYFLSKAGLQFEAGAKNGSKLGRTIFRVYKKGKPGYEHACFTNCQPDYFYSIASSEDSSDFSTVYYSYPLDILEARRRFGDLTYKTEGSANRQGFYDDLPDRGQGMTGARRNRRVPVLEVWTKDHYALVVGENVIHNGTNPYKWSDTAEGFIPFVVIENIRDDGETSFRGEADIGQARELNEQLNYLLSRKQHVVNRWLVPTIVWEGAPQNAAEIIAQSTAGGGLIPSRLGSKISFLAYDRPNPAVLEQEQMLRQAILECSGMNEQALTGNVQGSINTGPALAAQFQPVLSTVGKKRMSWTAGLQELDAKLLQIQEDIGDSKALGQAVINESTKTAGESDGELVPLSGKDIAGLREVEISWPGILPKDDTESARLEMEKSAQGIQSIYTTLEKLGEEYPDDEIARIRMENADPQLRGEKVAEQMRAQAPLMKPIIESQLAQQQGDPSMEDMEAEEVQAADEELLSQGDIGARLRALQASRPALNFEEDEPVVESGLPY